MFVGPFLIDDTRLEWVKMPVQQLIDLVMRFVVRDEMLSAESRDHPVYNLDEHDCGECFSFGCSCTLRFAGPQKNAVFTAQRLSAHSHGTAHVRCAVR